MGVIFGFVGLSKLTSQLIDKNSVLVTAVFSGLIIGTFPQLWKESSQKGRNKNSYIGLILGFIAMLIFLIFMKTNEYLSLPQNIFRFFLCGILWGLSSSTLLLFFGLYQPMLEGIASFNLRVILPLLAGMLVSVLSLSQLIEFIFEKYHSVMSHTILGIVVATVVMLFPPAIVSSNIFLTLIFIALGTLVSYKLTDICDHLKETQ